jgi:hypothetical protein
MADLIATKSMTYNTRRLMAGDLFQAKPRDARVLTAIGKARLAGEAPKAAELEDIAAVRAEYEQIVGKRPFNGWDVATLREKMAAHVAGD